MLFSAGFAKADYADMEKQIIDYVNQERASAGLKQLKENKTLSKAAGMKAQDMLGNDYFAHTSPEGVDPWHWFKKAGYQYKYAGENLGMDFNTVKAVHDAWMKSPTHKDNIMSEKYEEMGVSVKDGIIDNKKTKVAVQMFGKKLNSDVSRVSDVVNGFNKQSEESQTDGQEKQLEESDNNKEGQKENQAEKEDSNEGGVIIGQTSVQPWQGEFEDEMLVFAEVKGNPQTVQAVVGDNNFELEKLRENIYMNLVTLEDVDLENDGVLIKAESENGSKQTAQIPSEQYIDYVVEKEEAKNGEDDDKNRIAAMAGAEKNKFLEKMRSLFTESGLIIVVAVLFILTVANVWVLEREEERLLQLKS